MTAIENLNRVTATTESWPSESDRAEIAARTANVPSLPDAVASLPVTRYKDAIFIPLPPALWRKALDGGCCCDVCKADGTGGYWDTLAVGKDAPSLGHNDFTYTVHYPALHPPHVRKAMRY